MVMSHILNYPGVYWVARILAIVVMAAITWLALLMVARFFRPRHAVAMLRADLPKVDELRGEFGGVKGAIRFNAQASALGVLEDRIGAVEEATDRLWQIVDDHSRGIEDLMKERGYAP
jgi:hypothetical protein